jgi:hypothetical protein
MKETGRSHVARAVASLILVGHLAVGIAALVLLPRGFPLTSIWAWSNTIVPAALSVTTAAALAWLLVKRSGAWVSVLVAAAAGGWTAAVATGVTLFPVSLTVARCAAPFGVALALGAVAWWARTSLGASAAAFVAGAFLGALEIVAQRAPPPTTRPAGGTLVDVRGTAVNEDAATGQLVVACGKQTMRIKPLLTFESRSPDATWTLLAPPDSFGPHRTPSKYEKTKTGFHALYTDDGQSTLVAAKDRRGGIELDALSSLPEPIYAHLDTWTALHFSFDAALAFGPTGAAGFPIEPADYPTGRPAQLAYLDASLTFRVVRAADGEKGPFTELAHGHLGRDEPLTIEIRPRDEKDKGCRLVFKDWTEQLSTELSPTAGWGVPQNAVQFFSRDGEAYVALTLAETGPGRGWASVGHAAGTYRNRLRIEPLR